MKYLRMMLFIYAGLIPGFLAAQTSVNVTIGQAPQWGPMGYNNVRYYYLPDVEAYYDLNSSMFIYYGGGVWLYRSYLPSHYKQYDLYKGYKVVMTDYRGETPYTHFKEHRVKYKKGYRGPAQKTIGQKQGGKTHHKTSEQKPKQPQKNGEGSNTKGGGKGNK
jgi:hypothetical protein